MIHTKDTIREMLRNNDRAVGRALIALAERQTADERRDETTRHHNNMGFMPAHAARGTSMARYFQRHGQLTPRQLAWWRVVTPSGKMRIEVYASQLLLVAKAKKEGRDHRA